MTPDEHKTLKLKLAEAFAKTGHVAAEAAGVLADVAIEVALAGAVGTAEEIGK